MAGLADAQSLTKAAESGSKSYLFYGPPGTWKTTLATKHWGKRKFWIDVDEKLSEMEHITSTERETITVWAPHESLVPGEVMVTNIDRTRRDVTQGSKILRQPRGYLKTVEVVNELLQLAKKASEGGEAFPYDLVVLD